MLFFIQSQRQQNETELHTVHINIIHFVKILRPSSKYPVMQFFNFNFKEYVKKILRKLVETEYTKINQKNKVVHMKHCWVFFFKCKVLSSVKYDLEGTLL